MVATVAVLSDIHGVLPALDAVLAEPDVAAADLVVVTGDHTWGPQPAEVLDRLTALGDRVLLVRGNADRELLQMSRGIDVGLDDDPLSVWGAAQLRADHQRLLDSMPEQVVVDVDGFGPVFFCHATPRDDEEVALVDSRIERWTTVLAGLDDEVRTVVVGHTHMPFLRLVDGRLVVNPGSTGLPYGRPGAHWAIMSQGAVTFGRTLIDPDELVRGVSASDFPDIELWADGYFRHPVGDIEVLAAFGPRDGRDDGGTRPVAEAGGNVNTVRRVGDTVHRSAGAWTPTIHALLAWVRARGMTQVPAPLGRGPDGVEVLTWIPGDVAGWPAPDWVWDLDTLRTAGRMLREWHDATVGFDMVGAVWRTPVREPAEVVCLNDAAPYNLVHDGERLAGFIDVDMASPGPRVWDLAYLAYRMCGWCEDTPAPAVGPTNAERLDVLLDGYGHDQVDPDQVLPTMVTRLEDLAAWTDEHASTTDRPELHEHAAMYRRDAARLAGAP